MTERRKRLLVNIDNELKEEIEAIILDANENIKKINEVTFKSIGESIVKIEHSIFMINNSLSVMNERNAASNKSLYEHCKDNELDKGLSNNKIENIEKDITGIKLDLENIKNIPEKNKATWHYWVMMGVGSASILTFIYNIYSAIFKHKVP